MDSDIFYFYDIHNIRYCKKTHARVRYAMTIFESV